MDAAAASAFAIPPVSVHRPTTAVEDTVTLAAGVWLLTGTYIDGWAHNNLRDLETFFTPWHAILYSGFAVCAVWIAALTWRRRAPGTRWAEAVPAGYGAAVAGVALFLASGAGDFAWHSVFGIEQNISALFSPSHLGLATGAFLILGAPFSAAWHSPTRPWQQLMPAFGSALLAGMVAAFILQEFAVFARHGLIQTFTSTAGTQPAVTVPTSSSIMISLASFLVSTCVLFVPVLLLSLRWRLPAAVPAAMALVPSAALQIMVALRDAWLVPVAFAGSVLVGVVWAVVRPAPDRPARLMTAAGLTPVAFWAPYFAGVALHDGALSFSPEIWAGTLTWAGLGMLALAALALKVRSAPAGS
ncbi:hypothetical protein QFZ35_000029 [Arthrobacter ulcerisalmonis]|uniref:hypothetical protein n=1 Tax=Arthrobacter sp. B1I2 TaxID=3042263 RepID=UPI00277F7457|nr:MULTISPECIES: hypothetical protein [Arthrobacter]MDQ0661531.1 hypothetical protein [Arthrobacter ulcerisalmonis]MDQ0729445.1 hypothetical protein [Arthrobacter sp. B1I2]